MVRIRHRARKASRGSNASINSVITEPVAGSRYKPTFREFAQTIAARNLCIVETTGQKPVLEFIKSKRLDHWAKRDNRAQGDAPKYPVWRLWVSHSAAVDSGTVLELWADGSISRRVIRETGHEVGTIKPPVT